MKGSNSRDSQVGARIGGRRYMGAASELMDLDVQIFRLQSELVKRPDAEGTKNLERLLRVRQRLLLKMEREENDRLANKKPKRPEG